MSCTLGVIAGALLQLKSEFCLLDMEAEWVVSSLLLGAFFGSLCGGECACVCACASVHVFHVVTG